MKITTKTGDRGETGMFGGRRVSKASNWMVAVGELDELTSFLGWCKCAKGVDRRRRDAVEKVQDDIYRIMGFVGFEGKWPGSIEPVVQEDVERLEELMKELEGKAEDLKKFIRPGSSEAAARFHLARTVGRRAERAVVTLMEKQMVDEEELAVVLAYLNRLSDLCFVWALSMESEVVTE